MSNLSTSQSSNFSSGKQVTLPKRPDVTVSPTADLFKVTPIPLDTVDRCNNLEPGDVVLAPLYISVDPYLTRLMFTVWEKVPFSQAVVQVVASRSKEYHIGQHLLIREFPWATLHVINQSELNKFSKEGKVLPIPRDPPYNKLSPSHFLGALGLTGQTAYYGLLGVGAFKDGESLFVSGAAGATGSMVGQIAKLKCKNTYVVGCAGGEEKVKRLEKDFKFDRAFNYKKFGNNANAMKEELKKLFPKGIDVYFDNTGGLVTECVWDLLNKKARVVICGQIARYGKIPFGSTAVDAPSIGKIEDFLYKLIYNGIRVEGFLVYSCNDWVSFYRDMAEWISKGAIKTEETVYQGIENVPVAFEGLFSGKNVGKTVINCSPKSKY